MSGPAKLAEGRKSRKLVGILAATSLLLLLLPGLTSAVAPPRSVSASLQPSATAGTVFLNVSATEALSFVPSSLQVAPGQSVHLMVTQEADFYHTFTLSRLANYALPTSATNLTQFLAANPPLVDLNLTQTKGSVHYANFTAPAAGSYQFFCRAYGGSHFQSGMFGTLVSSSSSSSPSSYSSSLLPIVAVVIVIVIVAAAVGVVMMRRKPKSPGPTPPTSPDATVPPPG